MATIIKSFAIDEAGNTIETPVSGLERLFGVRIDEQGRWEWRCTGKDGCNVHKIGYSSRQETIRAARRHQQSINHW